MNLQELKKKWDGLSTKRNLKESEALAAVNQNGDALKYVPEDFFSTLPLELTLEEIASKFGVDVSKIKIKK